MNNSDNLTFGGVLTSLFIFLLPFVVSKELFYGSVNAKFFFIVGFTLIITSYFSYLLFKNKLILQLKKRWLFWLMVIVVGIYFISSFSGVDVERSLWSDILRSTGTFFILILSILAFTTSEILTRIDWKYVRWSIIISSTILAVASFFGVDGFNITGNFFTIDFQDSGLTFGNSTFAGTYLFIGFIITLVEFFNLGNNKKARNILILSILLQFFSPFFINIKMLLTNLSSILSNPINILGSSRASGATIIFIAFFILGIVIIDRYCKSNKKNFIKIWMISLFALAVVAVGLLFTPGSFVQEKYIDSSTEARIIVWESGIDAIKDRPLLGWGPENFRHVIEKKFNNKLYLEENIGEIWFDRAHNIIIDTFVNIGLLGVIFISLAIIIFSTIFLRSYRRGVINMYEAILFGSLPFFHIFQSQTSFDTTSSYGLLSIILGYGLWLEKDIVLENIKPKNTKIIFYVQRSVSLIMIVIILGSFKYLLLDEFSRQVSLEQLFKEQNHEKQLELIHGSMKNKLDFETLRLSSGLMIKESFIQSAMADKNMRERINKLANIRLDVYEGYYLKYLERLPDDYRARMNYVNLLLSKTVLNEDRTKDAREIVLDSYYLSPNNPLTYVMDSVTDLYSGRFKKSKEKIIEGVSLNPQIEFSQEVLEYILEQEDRYPNIKTLNIKHL